MASLPNAPAVTGADPRRQPGPEVPLDDLQRDRLSLIGHMASSIAHELSNPLATIVASAQAMLSFWPSDAPAARWLAARRRSWPAPAYRSCNCGRTWS